MMDPRRFAELCELMIDGELTPVDAAELRAHLEANASAVTALHAATQEHVLCRTALRPADTALLAERTRRMLESWRPASGEMTAQLVLAKVDRRRRWATARRWGYQAAAALLMAALIPVVYSLMQRPVLAPDSRAPSLAAVTGSLRLDSGLALANGDRLGLGVSLVCGPSSAATLVWSDGTRISLGPDTMVAREPGPGQRLRLERGTVSVRAAHRPADEALEIICPDATARVVGTAFSATVIDGRSRLAVSAGLVRWQRAADGVWSLLGPGQQATAASLPMAHALLLTPVQIADVREAITAGREPWAGSWKILKEQLPKWLAMPVVAPVSQEVTAFFRGNEQHSAARQALYHVVQPALGLALAARLTGDESCGRAALAWVRAMTSVGIYGDEAGILGCDTLVVHGLQAADLLRGLPYWSAADTARVDAWIDKELASRVKPLRESSAATARWRGVAAGMSIAAWRGDLETVRALMAGLRADIPVLLSREALARLRADPDGHALHQALNHALLCADIARVAAGDGTPPPPAWNDAVAALIADFSRDDPLNGQVRFFLRALSGPAPWRSPAAKAIITGPDPVQFNYGWLFPTLISQDPRW